MSSTETPAPTPPAAPKAAPTPKTKVPPLSSDAQKIVDFLKANDGKPTRRTDLTMAADVFAKARAELVRLPSLPIVYRVWLHNNRS